MSSMLCVCHFYVFLQLDREDRLRRGLTVSEDEENLLDF